METESSRIWLALIRGVMPATHRVMSMADLRAACAAAGLASPRTHIASGNLLFRSELGEAELRKVLAAILGSFGLDNAVFLRRAEELDATIAALPFPGAARERPGKLLVSFMDGAPDPAALKGLVPDGCPERVALAGRALYVDHPEGVARSKLTGARIERALGPATARNWNTVLKLRALMG